MSEPAPDETTAGRFITEHLPALLSIVQQSDLTRLEIEEGEVRLRVHRAPVSTALESLPAELTPELSPARTTIVAPLVGTFFNSPRMGAPPLVTEGSAVEERTVVGVIEALSLLTEVEAGCSGTIVAILVQDGQPVEYGQPLFEVELRG